MNSSDTETESPVRHFLKSEEAQTASSVRSASMTVAGGLAYMTVIPPLPIARGTDAADQTRQIFGIIEERLARIGRTKRDIAHITIWIAHLHDFPAVTEVWNEWVNPQHPPVRACAQVNMANKDLRVEMIVVAAA